MSKTIAEFMPRVTCKQWELGTEGSRSRDNPASSKISPDNGWRIVDRRLRLLSLRAHGSEGKVFNFAQTSLSQGAQGSHNQRLTAHEGVPSSSRPISRD